MGKNERVTKLIVFDMDETLGAFTALSRDLLQLQPHLQNYALMKHMLDTRPAYFRPAIMQILKQVHTAKFFDPSLRIILYTNNSNSQWIMFILNYINQFLKLQNPLFDHVLDASQRTTLEKNVADLLHRSNLRPKKNHKYSIFFVDDQYHPQMIAKDVVYFHITPYKEPNHTDVDPSRMLFQHLKSFING